MGGVDITGKWIVIDARGPVLLVGHENVKGLSHRSQLGSVGSRVLHPALLDAIDTGEERDETHVLWDTKHHVYTRPLIAPQSGTPVGAIGIVTSDESPAPPQPQIGTWEWVIDPGDETRVGSRAAYWDPVMSKIYGDTDPDPQTPRDVSAWFADRLTVESRSRMADLIEQGVQTVHDSLYIIGYTILDDCGTPQNMRLAARGVTDSSRQVWLRGIAHHTNSIVHEQVPGFQEPKPGVQIADMFKLDQKAAFMAVNLDYGTFERWDPEGWHRHRLLPAPSGPLATLVHPSDHDRFIEFVSKPTNDPIEIVRMKRSDDTYGWMRVSARPLSGLNALRQLICRVEAL